MRTRFWTILVAIATLPTAGHAQDANTRIEAVLGAAAQAEIPASLLESKLNEGRAKGVPAARIASALETRLAALVRARQALVGAELGAISSGELSIAADALQAGVDEAAVIGVMRRAPAERRAVATAVLTQLVELGVASETALARVNVALERGGDDLVNLPAQASARSRGRGNIGGRRGGQVGPPAEVDAGVRGGVDLDLDRDLPGRP